MWMSVCALMLDRKVTPVPNIADCIFSSANTRKMIILASVCHFFELPSFRISFSDWGGKILKFT